MAGDQDALNYPYIRVRDVDWLKRTLLIFPHVVRMTPRDRAPADDPEVEAFNYIEGAGAPLLRAARLHQPHVYAAQLQLLDQLQTRLAVEGDAFLARFGRVAARAKDASSIGENLTLWERRLAQSATFQIHAWKLFEELTAFLQAHNLAWEPRRGMAEGPEYLEMHPLLGEAIMATLATACAENEGLQVVTEFPKLHGRLIGTPREEILSACIDDHADDGRITPNEIAEIFVYRRCNVDLLSAENIVALSEERGALAAFRGKLEDLAKSLPSVIHDPQIREEKIGDLLDDLFREWRREQANLGPSGRKFFGDGIISEAGKVAQKLLETALKPETSALTVAGVVIGKGAAPAAPMLSQPVLTYAGAGFVVAVVVRAVEAWRKGRQEAQTSPLRYLTSLQNEGVGFSFARAAQQ